MPGDLRIQMPSCRLLKGGPQPACCLVGPHRAAALLLLLPQPSRCAPVSCAASRGGVSLGASRQGAGVAPEVATRAIVWVADPMEVTDPMEGPPADACYRA